MHLFSNTQVICFRAQRQMNVGSVVIGSAEAATVCQVRLDIKLGPMYSFWKRCQRRNTAGPKPLGNSFPFVGFIDAILARAQKWKL